MAIGLGDMGDVEVTGDLDKNLEDGSAETRLGWRRLLWRAVRQEGEGVRTRGPQQGGCGGRWCRFKEGRTSGDTQA